MKRHSYTVRITLCTAIQAMKLERLLIKKYKPRDNSNQYELYDLTPSDLKVFETFKGEELLSLPAELTVYSLSGHLLTCMIK
jgi:hypothetical protein